MLPPANPSSLNLIGLVLDLSAISFTHLLQSFKMLETGEVYMQKYIRRLLLGTTVLTIIGTITLVPLKGQQINNDTKKTMKVLRRADHLGSGPSEQEVLDDLPITDAFSTEPSEPNKKTNREKKKCYEHGALVPRLQR